MWRRIAEKIQALVERQSRLHCPAGVDACGPYETRQQRPCNYCSIKQRAKERDLRQEETVWLKDISHWEMLLQRQMSLKKKKLNKKIKITTRMEWWVWTPKTMHIITSASQRLWSLYFRTMTIKHPHRQRKSISMTDQNDASQYGILHFPLKACTHWTQHWVICLGTDAAKGISSSTALPSVLLWMLLPVWRCRIIYCVLFCFFLYWLSSFLKTVSIQNVCEFDSNCIFAI